MGDLSELMASIAEKGIIEPIIVRQRGARFQIVAGERRYQAAVQVGLREIPVVIREVDDDGDHRDRADGEHPAEGPDAVRRGRGAASRSQTRCNYTHEDMARRLGKSRTSITESLSLNGMPDEVKNLCRLADIHSKSLLLQVVRQDDHQKMVALIEKISRDGGATREEVRKETAKPKPGRPRLTCSAIEHLPRHSSCSCASRSLASIARKSSRHSRRSFRSYARQSIVGGSASRQSRSTVGVGGRQSSRAPRAALGARLRA